ncbi:MAG: hypothetical protein EHM35_00505 [Planctomycetaceae bacterium]|nr:MAG: hypothetical protein EHM35_00505 [Planctomycetaceae bacterium]
MNDMLSKMDRKMIKKESGLKYAKVIRIRRDSHGYPDRLIEAKEDSGVEFRGWFNEGESAADIRWNTENVDGWPEELTP